MSRRAIKEISTQMKEVSLSGGKRKINIKKKDGLVVDYNTKEPVTPERKRKEDLTYQENGMRDLALDLPPSRGESSRKRNISEEEPQVEKKTKNGNKFTYNMTITIKDEPITLAELKTIQKWFSNRGLGPELFYLSDLLSLKGDEQTEKESYLLVIRGGINTILAANALHDELHDIGIAEGFKKKREYIFFSDNKEEDNSINLEHTPLLDKVCQQFLPHNEILSCEVDYNLNSNTYKVDLNKPEKDKIIGIQLGLPKTVSFAWSTGKNLVGNDLDISLENGDLFILV